MIRVVNISNAPKSGFQRQVEWRKFLFDTDEKFVKLYTKVFGFDSDGQPVNDEYPPFERILVASNVRMVNPANGVVAIADEQGIYHDSITGDVVGNPIGQYDYFEELIATQPLAIPVLIENIIAAEDQIYQSFNKRPS